MNRAVDFLRLKSPPAPAGMARPDSASCAGSLRRPCVRGDGPEWGALITHTVGSNPHSRGCSAAMGLCDPTAQSIPCSRGWSRERVGEVCLAVVDLVPAGMVR